jgi:hypothetical protein
VSCPCHECERTAAERTDAWLGALAVLLWAAAAWGLAVVGGGA